MGQNENDELIREIHSELKALTQKLESAFIKDDSGEPDFFGHRLYHKRRQEEEIAQAKVKTHVKSEITTWIVMGIIVVIGSSLIQTLLQYLIKSMGG